MERTSPQHKDRLFRLVFGEKENILSLYNALNNSHYDNPEDITITTLGDVIYAGMVTIQHPVGQYLVCLYIDTTIYCAHVDLSLL